MAKKTFAAGTFRSKTFACGAWNGVGVAPVPPPVVTATAGGGPPWGTAGRQRKRPGKATRAVKVAVGSASGLFTVPAPRVRVDAQAAAGALSLRMAAAPAPAVIAGTGCLVRPAAAPAGLGSLAPHVNTQVLLTYALTRAQREEEALLMRLLYPDVRPGDSFDD